MTGQSPTRKPPRSARGGSGARREGREHGVGYPGELITQFGSLAYRDRAGGIRSVPLFLERFPVDHIHRTAAQLGRRCDSLDNTRPGHGFAVLLNAARCPITWTEPTGVLITPLIRELIIHLDRHQDSPHIRTHAECLVLALLEPVPTTTFRVPIPEDPRIRTIADALLADPANPRDLATWADHTNTSVRTITRLLTQETGMTFAQWRGHVRIRAAITHLARGTSVGATARAVGYRQPGAFSEAFRRITGQHPGIYHPR